MFQFTGRFKKLKLQKSRFTKAITEETMKVVKEAMYEFIEAAIRKVPVFTGMSRGSYTRLAEEVGFNLVITPDPGAKRYPNKTPELGAILAEHQFVHDGRHIMVKFDPGVYHYWLSEFEENTSMVADFPYRAGNEPPWESFKAGREAFKNYLRAFLNDRVPAIKEFITATEVNINAR